MPGFTPNQIKNIRKNLLSWFQKAQRNLPWRKNYDPYQVWISEIMLQQTQVKTVLPYFDRWMEALPSVQSVAEADEHHLLKLWEGLGYYSRVRNIQKAAQQMVEKHHGKVPDSYEDILALPGIGRYTAGAISSIAYNQDHSVVDGNVIRVISRLLNYSKNTHAPESAEWFWKWATDLLPSGKARHFNQAMMELGALICAPKQPKCASCPLQKECIATRLGTVEELPNRGPKTEKISLQVAVAVIQKDGKVFIQRRPHSGLMGGLWEFPGGKIEEGEKPLRAIRREIKEELNLTLKNIKAFTEIKHAYTRFKVQLHCFTADYQKGPLRLNVASEGKWVKMDDLEKFAFPAANVRLIEILRLAE